MILLSLFYIYNSYGVVSMLLFIFISYFEDKITDICIGTTPTITTNSPAVKDTIGE